MKREARRSHTPTFKANGALAAVRGDKTVAELAKQFDVHANQVTNWKSPLVKRLAAVFDSRPGKAEPAVHLRALHAKFGWLALANDLLESAL